MIVTVVMKTALDVLAIRGVTAPIAVTNQELTINTLTDLALSSKNMIGVLMGSSVPQLSIPKMLEFFKAGQFPFDKLVQFFDFDHINEAFEASKDGSVIKPILRIG